MDETIPQSPQTQSSRRSGQIVRRGPRKWLIRIYLGRENGRKRYRGQIVHGTKKDADRLLNSLLRDRDQGTLIEPVRSTVSDYLDRWLKDAAEPKLRPRTYKSYKQVIDTHVKPAIGPRTLAKLSPLDIQGLYAQIQKGGLSARTVRYTHAILHSALRQAVKWRLMAVNPADAVDLPRQERTEMSALNPKQVRALLAAAEETRDHALFVLAVMTGLRPSEYLAVKWTDLDGDTLRIQRTLDRDGKTWRFAETKRARSRRTVRLAPTVIETLNARKKQQTSEKTAAGDEWKDHGLIFTDELGGPERIRFLVTRFKRLLKTAKLPDVRLYDLRHTAATLALAAGVPAKVISEQLGHATAAFTLDVYSHVLPGMQDSAAAKVEKLLFRK